MVPYLAVSVNQPFVGGDLLQAHRTACAEFLGADADFGAEPELCPVRKTRGRIDVHASCIHRGLEAEGVRPILRDDGFAVARAVDADMFQGTAVRRTNSTL